MHQVSKQPRQQIDDQATMRNNADDEPVTSSGAAITQGSNNQQLLSLEPNYWLASRRFQLNKPYQRITVSCASFNHYFMDSHETPIDFGALK